MFATTTSATDKTQVETPRRNGKDHSPPWRHQGIAPRPITGRPRAAAKPDPVKGNGQCEPQPNGRTGTFLRKWLLLREVIRDRAATKARIGAAWSIFNHFRDGDDACFPSFAMIAEEGGLPRRTAIRAVKWLEASGYVERVEQGGYRGGRGRSNRYRPLLERVILNGDEALAPFRAEKGDEAVSPNQPTAKGDRAVSPPGDKAVSPFRAEKGDKAVSPEDEHKIPNRKKRAHSKPRATTSRKESIQAKAGKSHLEVDDAVSRWNSMAQRAGLAQATTRSASLVSTRRKKLKARLGDLGGLAGWDDLLVLVEDSAFLTGKVKDFRATLDWVLKPANLAKILDGNYDDQPEPTRRPGRRTAVDAAYDLADQLRVKREEKQKCVN